MTIFVCVDDKGGMAFNHRRQSRDSVQLRDMLAEAQGRPLRISPRSAALFGEGGPVAASEDYLEGAGPEDLCFVEEPPLLPWADKIHRLILYRWNRAYPADKYLDIDLAEGWKCQGSTEFPGSSHDKITKETYIPCRK